MHVHPKRLPKLSTTKVGTRLSPQHGCPMSPAFAHRTKTIQPALLTAQMNDMPLDLSQSDLQARRGRTRTHIQSYAPWFGLCVHTTRIHPLQCHTSLCSRPIMHICMHMHMHMHVHMHMHMHPLCCPAVLVVRGGQEARPDQATSREARPEPAGSLSLSLSPKPIPSFPLASPDPSRHLSPPHVVCAAGGSPPSDQVARRLLRAGVRRRRNLAVVTRSQVRRGHDRRRRGTGVWGRFAAVYLRVL